MGLALLWAGRAPGQKLAEELKAMQKVVDHDTKELNTMTRQIEAWWEELLGGKKKENVSDVTW